MPREIKNTMTYTYTVAKYSKTTQNNAPTKQIKVQNIFAEQGTDLGAARDSQVAV